MGGFLIGLLNVLLVLTSLFLICLVLIQRGRGGGLAGAFGGVGGSSAFGTKAGDVFTRVTIGVAVFWFVLCMALVVLTNRETPTSAFGDLSEPAASTDLETSPAGAAGLPTSTEEPISGPDTEAPAATPSAPAKPAAPATDADLPDVFEGSGDAAKPRP